MSYDFDAFEQTAGAIKAENLEMLLAKQRDYGPGNIANCPLGPVEGLIVRLYDKLARLAHLVQTGADPQNESLVDTANDIENYGTILRMVLDGAWPGLPDGGWPLGVTLPEAPRGVAVPDVGPVAGAFLLGEQPKAHTRS